MHDGHSPYSFVDPDLCAVNTLDQQMVCKATLTVLQPVVQIYCRNKCGKVWKLSFFLVIFYGQMNNSESYRFLYNASQFMFSHLMRHTLKLARFF